MLALAPFADVPDVTSVGALPEGERVGRGGFEGPCRFDLLDDVGHGRLGGEVLGRGRPAEVGADHRDRRGADSHHDEERGSDGLPAHGWALRPAGGTAGRRAAVRTGAGSTGSLKRA